MVRVRAVSLVAATLLLAGAALSAHGGHARAVSHDHPDLAIADQASAIVVSTAADVQTMSGSTIPLAALGATVALAIGYSGRRDSSTPRASYAVRQRLVRAGRRAPPCVPALQML
jgi:hypothetical protein